MTPWLSRATARFLCDETGSLGIMTLGLLPAMLVAGGMAVDYMHMESSRVRLQATLDRAVLAAAALDQTREPEAVVRDYFARAGLGDRLASVEVEESLNFREVSATAAIDVDTFFLRLVGFDRLTASAAGSAIESHSSVEISLVLDVSGSMNDNQRLPRLKSAASNFVDAVLRSRLEGDEVSVTIVPFSTQVSAGPGILQHVPRSGAHEVSHCIDFQGPDFDSTEVDLSATYAQTGQFDPFTTSATPIEMPVCPPVGDVHRRILHHSGDADALKARIGGLSASGNTSIDLGVKWGAWLLDPTSRPVVDAGIAAGAVDADFAGRPLAHEDTEAMKVLIVMSDGANTTQYRLAPEFADGPSHVWRDPDTGRTSSRFWNGSRHVWFAPHDEQWRSVPYDDDGDPYDGAGDPLRLDDVALWRDYSIRWYAYNHWYRWSGSSDAYWREVGERTDAVQPAEKDRRTQDICRAARDRGIVVFTIGFEAGDHGDATLRDCASSAAHFFDVEGLQIEEAFRAISSTINRLRLSS
jgi:Flp pilus assembly protein TadG